MDMMQVGESEKVPWEALFELRAENEYELTRWRGGGPVGASIEKEEHKQRHQNWKETRVMGSQKAQILLESEAREVGRGPIVGI